MSVTSIAGSVWRKWDLHIHTPHSYHQYFGNDWDVYVENLKRKAIEHDIEVCGISDYFSIDGYTKLLNYCDDPSSKNPRIKLSTDKFLYLIPAVELRLDNFVQNVAINLHVFFNPEIRPENIKSFFLDKLSIKYRSHELTCTELELIKIGSAESNNVQYDPNLNVSGLTDAQRKNYLKSALGFVSLSCSDIDKCLKNLVGIFEKSGLKKNYYLIGIAGKGHGGLSDLHWHDESNELSRAGNVRQALLNYADIVLSNHPADRQFFLGRREGTAKEEIITRFKGLKPCLWGSDAHTLENLFHPSDGATKDYTWIKADCTFEGLRQVLFEPEHRLVISENRPLIPIYSIQKIVLDIPEGTLLGEDIFCLNKKYEFILSPYLTCFIGGRGSGKSSILNLVADRMKSGSSQFFKQNKLKIANGKSIDQCVFIDDNKEEKYAEFLSQNQIEAFALDYKLFTDSIYLRILKRDEEESIAHAESALSAEVLLIEKQIEDIRSRREKEILKSGKEKELETNRKLLSSLESTEYKALTKELGEYDSESRNLKNAKTKFNQLLTRLSQVVNDSSSFEDATNAVEIEFNNLLTALQAIEREARAKSFKEIDERMISLDASIKDCQLRLQEYLAKQGISKESLNDIAGASQKINDLTAQIGDLLKIIASTSARIDAFNLAGVLEKKINYEEALSRNILAISKHLETLSDEVKPIKLQYEFFRSDANNFILDKFQQFFKRPENISQTDLASYMFDKQRPEHVKEKSEYLVAVKGDSKNLIKTQKYICDVLEDDVNFEIFKLLIQRAYSDAARFKLIKVFYDGKPLKNTSFGQRCTAAIVILLVLGNNPIIIDEPEAHLDSALIANYLVEVIKTRKQARQIIFATHNANFVINGDSELIYSLENHLNLTEYTSTTIENLNHRDKLLRLEGGKEAFQMRGDKYDVKVMV